MDVVSNAKRRNSYASSKSTTSKAGSDIQGSDLTQETAKPSVNSVTKKSQAAAGSKKQGQSVEWEAPYKTGPYGSKQSSGSEKGVTNERKHNQSETRAAAETSSGRGNRTARSEEKEGKEKGRHAQGVLGRRCDELKQGGITHSKAYGS